MLEGLGLQKIFATSIKLGGAWIGGPFIAGAVSLAPIRSAVRFRESEQLMAIPAHLCCSTGLRCDTASTRLTILPKLG